MNLQKLKELALHAANRTAPAEFTTDTVDEALRDQLGALARDYLSFERNKLDLFEIIMTTADEVVPKRVLAGMGRFAEIQRVKQGQKALFRQKLGRDRARKFLTQVGLSGVYQSFRLDAGTFSVEAHAHGGAVTIDFERFLDGAEVMADLMEIIVEGLVDSIYGEVQKALIAAASSSKRPANSKVSATFSAAAMEKLVNTVKAYGNGAAIFAPPEFISAMGPDAIVPTLMSSNAPVAQGVYAPGDIDDIHNFGRIRIFRGTPIVEIPQSFIDERNEKTWINPQYAYVLPTGGEKVVKIVLEGETQMWDMPNRDQSREINVYRKIGVAILTQHNWGIYRNTDITDTSEFPYGTL